MPGKRRPKAPDLQARKIKALEAWNKDPTLKITKLALEYDIPVSSIYARTRGRKTHIEAAKNQKLFDDEEEKALVEWCIKLINWGHPPRVETLRTLTSGLLQIKTGDSNKRVGKHWTERFIERHKQLETTYSQALDNNRAKATHPETIRR